MKPRTFWQHGWVDTIKDFIAFVMFNENESLQMSQCSNECMFSRLNETFCQMRTKVRRRWVMCRSLQFRITLWCGGDLWSSILNYCWLNKADIVGLKLHSFKQRWSHWQPAGASYTRTELLGGGGGQKPDSARIVNVIVVSRVEAAENLILAFTVSATDNKARCSSDADVTAIDMWHRSQNQYVVGADLQCCVLP